MGDTLIASQQKETTSVSMVTGPLRAKARPYRVASGFSVIPESARMFPRSTLRAPSVTEPPASQKPGPAHPPLVRRTGGSGGGVRSPAVRNTQKPSGLFAPLSMRGDGGADERQ